MNVVARLDAVSKRFGAVTAVDGASAEFTDNRIHGLLGRNGAGKTTVMQLLTGQLRPSAGRVELFGFAPYENAGALAQVCLIREAQRYPDAFRVRHALRAAALLFERWDAAYADELVADFALPLDRRVKRLSRGMLSTLGVIIGLASRAPLTFFDEPYLGLDAVARQMFYDRLLADFAEHPRTVVLSTHLIDEVADLIERVVLIERGRVLMQADADELRESTYEVSGPADAVAAYAAGHTVLHRQQLGGQVRATVRGAGAPADGIGLRAERATLQQLVVRTTQYAEQIEDRTPRGGAAPESDVTVPVGAAGGELR